MPKNVLAIRHVPHESLGTLRDYLESAGVGHAYLDVYQEQGFRFNAANWAGLVVLGGPMNVDQTDRFGFLAAEVAWIRLAIAANLPLLGICLGSQLLAKALGGRVYPNGVKEIGWYPLEITAAAQQDRLFAGSRPVETVFQWHGDTFDLPSDAVLLATSPLCKHQAFRIGDTAYGLQFHLEMTGEMIHEWLAEPDNCGELSELDYVHPHAILAQTPTQLSAMQELADRVFGRFAQMCAANLHAG